MHFKTKRFYQVSEELGADILGTNIREVILKLFRWNKSAFTHPNPTQEFRDPTRREEGSLNSPRDSIGEDILLDALEDNRAPMNRLTRLQFKQP